MRNDSLNDLNHIKKLPLDALPDLIRGISQFKKSGLLYLNSQSHSGHLSFIEGKMLGLQFDKFNIKKSIINRLSRGGILPENSANVLIDNCENINVDDLGLILRENSYLLRNEFEKYYEAELQDLFFSLFELREGYIFFKSIPDSNIREDLIGYSFIYPSKNKIEGVFPCQYLLDYVEYLDLSLGLNGGIPSNGDKAILIEGNESSNLMIDTFLDSSEKRLINLAKLNYSLSEILCLMSDSRLTVMKLLSELKNSEVISFTSQAPSDEVVEDVEDNNFNTEIDIQENKNIFDELTFSKINEILLTPRGIEYVVGVFMFLGIISSLYYFYYSLGWYFNDIKRMFA